MLSSLLGEIFINIIALCSWSKIYNEKINFKNIDLYIGFFGMNVLIFAVYILSPVTIKVFPIFLILWLANLYVFKKGIKESFVCTILYEACIFVSEILFSITTMLLFPNMDIETYLSSFAGSMIASLIIGVICILLLMFKFIQNGYRSLIKTTDKIKTRTIIIIGGFIIISFEAVFGLMYSKASPIIIIVSNSILMILYTIIILESVKTANEYNHLFDDYNSTIDSLKDYERMLDQYKVSNHENKNQWLTVRNMIDQKDQKTIKYIDTLVDNKIMDDEKLLFETSIIPEGGLRATIYSKLLLMKSKKVKYSFNIDRKVRTTDLIKLGDYLLLDICKVVSVFLDNAIEEVLTLEDGTVGIELYVEDDFLCINVSNEYRGTIEIDKIDNPGYTTKENGHGYGLSLVKQIIEKNPRLTSKKELTDSLFIQKIMIKTK